MPLYLKQSTQVSVPVGPLFDSTDFISEKTDVAYNAAGIDVDVIKSGTTKADVTLANSAGDGYWRHVSNGNYAVTLSTTDTNTLGSLRVTFKATGVLDWWQDFEVVPAAVYDSIIAGSDKLPVDVQEISSDAMAADNCELMFDGTGYAGGTTKLQVVAATVSDKTGYGLANGAITAAVIATDAIDGDAIAATAVSEIQNGLATAAALTTVDGKVDTVDAVVDAIKLKTDTIPANPAAVGSAMTLTAAYDAAKTAAAAGAQMDLVNAPNPTAVTAIQNGLALTGEAATAVGTLNDFDPATEEVNIGSVNGVAVTSVDDFKADVSGLALTGEAATAVATLTIPSAADNADAVWNEARVDHSTAGSFGQGVASVQGNVTGSVDSVTDPVTVGTNNDKTDYALSAAGVSAVQSGLSTLTAQQVWEYGARTLSSFGTLVSDVTTGVWGAGTRTLSGFGTLVTDLWEHATRSLTDKADFTLTAAYDPAKNAASPDDVTTAVSGLSTFDPSTTEVDIGAVKGVAVTSVADFKADVSGLAATGEAATAVGTLSIPTAADVADAVWNEATADHQTAGSAGKALTDAGVVGDPWSTAVPGEYGAGTAGAILGTNLNATVSSRSTLTAQQVWEYSTRTLSSFGTLVADIATGVWGAVARTITGGTVTTVSDKTDYALSAAGVSAVQSGLAATGEAATAVGALVIPSAADNADAVWDEAVADHTEAGSTGNALTAAGSAGDPWSTTLPGAYGDNTAGKIVGTNLDTTVSSRSTLTAAQVWANGTRSLTTFGTLVADVAAGVWGAVARTITGGTVTTNSDKSGYSLAADQAVNVTKVGGTVVAGPDDLKADVSELATSAEVGALNDLSTGDVETAVGTALGTYDGPTKAELDSAVSPLATAAALTTVSGKVDTVDTVVDAIKLKTDNLPASPAAVGSAMTLSVAERAAVAAALLATNITYPDGSTKTVEEILEEVWATTAGDTNITNLVQQFLWPDNQTVAVTYDIDDADAPTSRTRQ
jgi:hypothetical protein